MSTYRYALSVTSRLASGKLATDVKHYTSDQQDEAWGEWRRLREAPSTRAIFLRYTSGYVLAYHERKEGEAS